jgi:hypothetical protein
VRAVLLAPALLLTGCTAVVSGSPVPVDAPDTSKAMVTGYFKSLNDSGEQGAEAQLGFLRRTQHPDFGDRICDLGGLILTARPSMSTLRPDRTWAPEAGERPRGDVYVIAVSLSVRRAGQVVGEQIGSDRVAVLNGSVYGFMPCPRR